MANVFETTQQIVLSVRMRGDSGPQTGDVVLAGGVLADWQPGVKYNINEMVAINGRMYRAKEEHTSGDNFDPSMWEEVDTVDHLLPDYMANYSYEKDEVAVVDGKIYRAKEDFISGETFDPSHFEELDSADLILKEFENNYSYEANQAISHLGRIYKAKTDFTSTNQFNPDDWQAIDNASIHDFEPKLYYPANATVVYEGSTYRAKAGFVAGETFVEEDWEQIGGAGSANDFEANKFYKQYSTIVANGRLYRAKQDFKSASVFNPADWEPVDEAASRDFQANTFYPKDSVIVDNSIIYRAKSDFTSGDEFSATDWEQIGGAGVNDFEPNHYYNKNTIIAVDGRIYRAKENFTSGETFDDSKWEELDSVDSMIFDFKQNYAYEKSEACSYNGAIYRAKYAFTSGSAFNPADWERVGLVHMISSDDGSIEVIEKSDYVTDLSAAAAIKVETDRASEAEKELQETIEDVEGLLENEVERSTGVEEGLQEQIDELDSRTTDVEGGVGNTYTKAEVNDLIEEVRTSTYHFIGFIGENEPSGYDLETGVLWHQSDEQTEPKKQFPWTGMKVWNGEEWIDAPDYTPTDWNVWTNLNEHDNHPDWFWFGEHWSRIDQHLDLSPYRTAENQDIIDETFQKKLGGSTDVAGKLVVATKDPGVVQYVSQGTIIGEATPGIAQNKSATITSPIIGSVRGTEETADDANQFGGDIYVDPLSGKMTVNKWGDTIDELEQKVSSGDLSQIAFSGNYSDLKNIPTDTHIYPAQGGNAGQVMIKNSNADGDFAWADLPDNSDFVKSVASIKPDAQGNVDDRVFLTKAEYDNLSTQEKQSNKIFVITDYPTGPVPTAPAADGKSYVIKNGEWVLPPVTANNGDQRIEIAIHESGQTIQPIPGTSIIEYVLGSEI